MLTLVAAVDLAESWVRASRRAYVCHLDARSVLAARDDEAVMRAYEGAAIAAPDGMPLVWIGRRRSFAVGRVYGPDFMQAMLARTSGWTDRACRHLLLGGEAAVLPRLAERLGAAHPGTAVVTQPLPCFPWSADTEEAIIAAANAAAPDIVWVALGAPRQDLWMAAARARLTAPLLVGVGAAFDFLGGSKPQAPGWMQRAGLEWAFRVATEPRRLGGRYLRTVPRFAVLALIEQMRRRGA